MKKMYILFLVIAFVVSILAGCNSNADNADETLSLATGGTEVSEQTENTRQTDVSATQGTESTEATNATQQAGSAEGEDPTQETEPEDENVPKLDVQVFEENDLFNKSLFSVGKDMGQYINMSGNQYHLKDTLLKQRPTTALRVVSEKRSYAMYDSDTGFRVYLFFNDAATVPQMVGFPVVIKEVLPYSAFSKLKVGDSIDEVEKIDSVTKLYKDRYQKLSMKDVTIKLNSGDPVCTIHYLEDGILKIHYTMQEEGKLIIAEMVYSKDYCVQDMYDRTINCKIKNVDLPTT